MSERVHRVDLAKWLPILALLTPKAGRKRTRGSPQSMPVPRAV